MISLEQYGSLRSGAGAFVRGDRGRITLRGQDRTGYLHGLLTNDIAALRPGSGCYAALLTPQGRMISDMRVFELGDMILLDLHASLAPQVRDHLDRFVITEDVVVEDATASLGQVGVYGPRAAAVLAATLAGDVAAGEAAPDAATLDARPLFGSSRWSHRGTAAILLRSDDVGVHGFDVVVPASAVDGLMRALDTAGAMRVDESAVEAVRVEAGRPKFLVDMDTSTIPLEASIEDRAISMSKGCYVGQEVIVRVLHRGGGRVARKLVGIVADGAVQRGDAVFSGDREAGEVTSAVDSPLVGRWIALAYVRRELSEPDTPVLIRSDGTDVTARVAAVPFASPMQSAFGIQHSEF